MQMRAEFRLGMCVGDRKRERARERDNSGCVVGGLEGEQV